MTHLVKVPSRILHQVPDEISFAHASLTEPCCVAYNAAVVNSDIRPGDRVVVLGPGPIGILCAVMTQLCGAEVALVGLVHILRRGGFQLIDCQVESDHLNSLGAQNISRLDFEGLLAQTIDVAHDKATWHLPDTCGELL